MSFLGARRRLIRVARTAPRKAGAVPSRPAAMPHRKRLPFITM
jgi:hypothetical protein